MLKNENDEISADTLVQSPSKERRTPFDEYTAKVTQENGGRKRKRANRSPAEVAARVQKHQALMEQQRQDALARRAADDAALKAYWESTDADKYDALSSGIIVYKYHALRPESDEDLAVLEDIFRKTYDFEHDVKSLVVDSLKEIEELTNPEIDRIRLDIAPLKEEKDSIEGAKKSIKSDAFLKKKNGISAPLKPHREAKAQEKRLTEINEKIAALVEQTYEKHHPDIMERANAIRQRLTGNKGEGGAMALLRSSRTDVPAHSRYTIIASAKKSMTWRPGQPKPKPRIKGRHERSDFICWESKILTSDIFQENTFAYIHPPVDESAWAVTETPSLRQEGKERAQRTNLTFPVSVGDRVRHSVTLPIKMTRPLPPGKITEVRVQREKCEHKGYVWEVLFKINTNGFRQPFRRRGQGVVAVGMKATRQPDRSVLVAEYAGSDGRSGRVVLPARVYGNYEKVGSGKYNASTRKIEGDGLTGARADCLNEYKPYFADLVSIVDLHDRNGQKWTEEKVKESSSYGKFLWMFHETAFRVYGLRGSASLVSSDGTRIMFEHLLNEKISAGKHGEVDRIMGNLLVWRHRHRHLSQWMSASSAKFRNHRDTQQAAVVAHLRREYGTIILTDETFVPAKEKKSRGRGAKKEEASPEQATPAAVTRMRSAASLGGFRARFDQSSTPVRRIKGLTDAEDLLRAGIDDVAALSEEDFLKEKAKQKEKAAEKNACTALKKKICAAKICEKGSFGKKGAHFAIADNREALERMFSEHKVAPKEKKSRKSKAKKQETSAETQE